MQNLKEKNTYNNAKQLIMYHYMIGEHPLHWHNELELAFITEGSVIYTIHQKQFVLKAGDFILLNGGVLHSTASENVSASEKAYTMLINSSVIPPQYAGKIPNAIYRNNQEERCHPEHRYVYRLVESIFYEYAHNYLYKEHILETYIGALIPLCLRSESRAERIELSKKEVKESRIYHQIITFLRNSEYSEHSLQAVAKALGYSPNYLCRVFKNASNMSISQYTNEMRLTMAKHLLWTTQKSICDISAECGFSSERAFHIAFKKENGMTPLAYRKTKNSTT